MTALKNKIPVIFKKEKCLMRKGTQLLKSFTGEGEEVKGITTFRIKGFTRLVIATTKGVYFYPPVKEENKNV